MKRKLIIFIIGWICMPIFSSAQQVNGIYSLEQITLSTPYTAISPLGKYRYDSLSYLEAQNQKDYIFEAFLYESDGYEVEGFACRPKNTSQKVPVIIYNRGGTGNFGKLSEEDLPDFYWLAKQGFAVYASNYRFVGDLGPYDQSGGDEINDVLNLTELVKDLDLIDSENVFIMGVSRGGSMTYQSIREKNYNAAAVIAGVSDLYLHAEDRPIFITGWSDLEDELNYKGLENILPDFKQRKGEFFDKRSSVKWANEIDTPLLILHSRQDGLVLVENALKMAQALQVHDKEYQLKIYNQKSHGLPYSKFDSFEQITEWFKAHMK